MAKRQASGLYRSKVKIGVDANGKDLFKYISGRTKKELELEKQKAIAYYIDGTGLEEDRLFGEYAVKWFETKKKRVSESSKQSYRTALNKDILPVFGSRNLGAIKPTELQEFVDGYAGMSATKITMITASLDGIFKAACVDRIIRENPMRYVIKPEASEAEEKIALTDEQRRRIEELCRTHEHGAYLAVMFYLGCRPGEARGLMWGDIDWAERTVHIQRDIDYKNKGAAGDVKNKSSRRVIPMPEPLAEILTPLRSMPNMYIFRGNISGQALSKTTAERIWVELMVECGMAEELEPGANGYRDIDIRAHYKPMITPHVLRHNFITMCWENGIDPYITMRLVGHKSIKTTMDIYTHLSDKSAKIAAVKVNQMFEGQKISCTKVAQNGVDTLTEKK